MTGTGGFRVPQSVRARLTLSIAIALLAAVLGFQGVSAVLDARAHDALERTLAEQAAAVALAVDREGTSGATRAAGLLTDTRIVVRRQGEVQYWNRTVRRFDATASVRRGDLEVVLQRDEHRGLTSRWLAPLLIVAVLAGLAALTWLAAARISRRLRREAAELAGVAERVAQGDLAARAPVPRDELGRIAQAFNRMAERLQRADAREREFLADVAHELRTPVTAIDGFARALADGTAHRDEDREEALALIRTEAARLHLLVRDLRELTWLDLEPEVAIAKVDLGEVARESAARITPAAAAAGVVVAAPDAAFWVETDRHHVLTILGNLLDNAVRHTPAGGRVRVDLEAGDGSVTLLVADTGVGIPPEHLERLFDRLYRVELSRWREQGGQGSGLGLAIVRRTTELLGGRVMVESHPGHGTTFRVVLPGTLHAPRQAPRREGVPA